MDARRSAMQKRISRRQEKNAAADLGGRVQAASGATKHGGADVRAPGYRVECKYTEKGIYSLKRSELEKLVKQAHGSLEQPVLQLAFVDKFGRRTEFAFLRYHKRDVPGWVQIDRVKTTQIGLASIQVQLANDSTYALRFGDDDYCWVAKNWDDFVRETNSCS